ncbi:MULTISPECIES: hypothetical protein [Nocardia]|uniref:TRAFAC clade GTPase domain-containing protein n=1 Tax=Nocardia TaxID=1817 RepID=UPI001D0CAE2E|nr:MULTISPECIES: hypothetical protein [Nocardia]
MIKCRHCLQEYPLTEIYGLQRFGMHAQMMRHSGQDLEGWPEGARPWSEVRPAAVDTSRRRVRFKRADKYANATNLGGGFDPYCPYGHVVIDALADKPFVITVAGNVNAAKSTYLLGTAAEIFATGRLGPVGISASILPSQVDALRAKIDLVYGEGQPLPPTPEEEVHEGYVARLQLPDGTRRSLAMFDVSGEVIRNVQKSAQSGRFLYESDAIILLLDPDGFPDRDAFMKPIVPGTDLAGPQQVSTLADGIEQVTERKVNIPIIVTVSKADKFGSWSVDVPQPKTLQEVDKYLREESKQVQEFLISEGLEPVVSTAIARFGEEKTGFARVSALGMDYGKQEFGGTLRPDGCWRPVASAISLGGM